MGKRRSRGEGSLYFWEEKGLWVAKVSLPDGKRRTKYGKTQKEVKDWLLNERKSLADGVYIADNKMTVESFLQRYLADYAKNSVRASTYRSYSNMIGWHIVPEIGHIRLTQLRADQLNHLYAKKLESGLSTRTVEYIHGIIRRSLNKAVKWGLLARNPTDLASPPKVEKKIPSVWSAEQTKLFLDAIKDDRWAAVFYLAAGTGMREGEILGLRLADLDLAKGYLKVTQTVQFIQGQGLVFSEPKTDKSRRMIVLPSFVTEALRIHLVKRETLKQLPSWKGSDLVFTTNIGTPISPRNLIRHFKNKLTDAGLPEIRFHDLRHTTASLLLEKNTHPKVVQELLGHSTITLTLNTYSHIINPLSKDAADRLDDIFK